MDTKSISNSSMEPTTTHGNELSSQTHWNNTTHQFLFFDVTYSIVERIYGFLMISVQCTIYAIMTYLFIANDSEQVSVTVSLANIDKSDNQKCVSDLNLSVNDFYCNGDEGAGNASKWAAAVAVILMFVFLTPDVVKAISTFKYGKIASILIIFESFCGLCATLILITALPYDASALDIVLGAVGVVFIHDMDEKIYEAIEAQTPKMKKIYLAVLVFVVGAGFLAASV